MSYHHFANDIYAAQALGTTALDYAQRSISPQDGPQLIGTHAVAALDLAKELISTDDSTSIGSGGASDTLRDLQLAAVAFTTQAAQSNNRSKRADPETFQQIEEKIVAMLEVLGTIAHISLVRDDIIAARRLASCAFEYAKQIIIAEDSGAPVGSPPVARALGDLHGAAISFTVQLAISRKHADPKALRRIEKQLVALFSHQEDPQ